MNSTRYAIVLGLGIIWCGVALRAADESTAPFAMDKQYSADLTISMKDGMVIKTRTFVDNDKMRTDMTMNGMNMATIVRKDKQKIYEVMTQQKIVMEMAFDPGKFKGRSAASFGPQGNFELIGADTIEGVACTKYKVTSGKDKQVFFFWLDVAHKTPVEMAAEDGSLTVKWKNYATGPQAPSLFEIPEGFQVMPMPDMPGLGGSGDSGQ